MAMPWHVICHYDAFQLEIELLRDPAVAHDGKLLGNALAGRAPDHVLLACSTLHTCTCSAATWPQVQMPSSAMTNCYVLTSETSRSQTRGARLQYAMMRAQHIPHIVAKLVQDSFEVRDVRRDKRAGPSESQ